jgi:hypothetical protein
LARASILLLPAVLAAQVAGAAESVRVTGDRVNLRSAPNTTSRIVAKVDKGTVIEVLGREGSWIRVTAPGSGSAAYVSASLCEPVAAPPPAASAAASQPATSQPAAPAPSARPGQSGGSSREPLQLGGHASWANKGIDFGLGARASTGLPGIRHLGALIVVDYFFGAPSTEDAEGIEVDVSGHSIQLGVFPTYSFDAEGVHGYVGAGLSYIRSSVTASVSTPVGEAEGSASASSTSLGLVAGAKFKGRFFGEVRYQFGDASHLTLSAGILFNGPR